MDKKKINRRRFIKTAGVAASVAIIVPSVFDFDSVVHAAPVMRRNIAGLTTNSPVIVSYKKAIAAMKALPNSNPLSWGYQAAIHGTTLAGNFPAWKTCQHHTLFFWSWHRMYLYWFERIIRKHSNNANFALPFWNYSSSAAQRKIPAMFRDSASVLFANRNAAMNNGTGSLPASSVNTAFGMAETAYADGSDSLESTPHDAVHVGVGGIMGSVSTAAQDPLFYIHHCNIDRLWNIWLAQGGGRSNPLNNNAWKTNQYTFFNENGAQVKMTGCQVLRAAGQLNYTYEGEPTQVQQFCPFVFNPAVLQREVLFRVPIPPVELGDERFTFRMPIKELRPQLTRLSRSTTETVVLEIDGVEADLPPGLIYELYMGLPEGVEPDPTGPYYIGNITLFSTGVRSESHHDFKPASFRFRINKALAAALRTTGDEMPVTVVPRGIEVDGRPSPPRSQAKVRVGSATMTVQRNPGGGGGRRRRR